MDYNEKDFKKFFAYFGVFIVLMRIIVFLKEKKKSKSPTHENS